MPKSLNSNFPGILLCAIQYHTIPLAYFQSMQHYKQKHTTLKTTYNIKNDRTTKPQSTTMRQAYQTT
jgi:hypothetical protein